MNTMASPSATAADFSCSICLDIATEPVVTRCGHLFCWACLDHWLHSADGAPECPVCKGRVDDRIAGDIIPLYGKGRQLASKATSNKGRAATPASAAAPTTAGVDDEREAFFSRPSAYSFCPFRDAQRAAQASSQRHERMNEQQPHPRPSAARAPPHPRTEDRPQFQNAYINRGGVPLTMGSGIFFFGGGTGMVFSIFVISMWSLYHYAPWREWAHTAAQWFDRLRGRLRSANTTQSAQGTVPEMSTRTQSPLASQPPRTETQGDDASPPAVIRHLIILLFFVFVLIQLAIYM